MTECNDKAQIPVKWIFDVLDQRAKGTRAKHRKAAAIPSTQEFIDWDTAKTLVAAYLWANKGVRDKRFSLKSFALCREEGLLEEAIVKFGLETEINQIIEELKHEWATYQQQQQQHFYFRQRLKIR